MSCFRPSRSSGFVLSLVLAAPLAADPTTWPQWRGPQRDGQAPAAPAWPQDLKNLEQTWRVELGPSYSGPIVAEDRVFVTETVDEQTEVVRALDRATGKELWKATWPGSMSVPFFAKRSGDWIRATPAYDGDALYVAGMCDVLVCLDAKTGAERWRVDFTQRYSTELPSFGYVPSPLVDDTAVYAQAGQSFVKLDKRDGQEIWRTLTVDGRNMMESGAFSSPIFARFDGRPQILVQTRVELCGVDPQSGDVIWRHAVPAFRGCNILTPTVYGDAVFTSTYQNKAFLYDIKHPDGRWTCDERWTNRKAQGYMSTPVIVGDYAYLHLGNGRLCCLDLKTGEETWRSEKFGEYWSLVAQGDRILALDARGELILFAADPKEFRLIDRRKVSEQETWGHLAVADHDLFVRELRAIAAYRWK